MQNPTNNRWLQNGLTFLSETTVEKCFSIETPAIITAVIYIPFSLSSISRNIVRVTAFGPRTNPHHVQSLRIATGVEKNHRLPRNQSHTNNRAQHQQCWRAQI